MRRTCLTATVLASAFLCAPLLMAQASSSLVPSTAQSFYERASAALLPGEVLPCLLAGDGEKVDFGNRLALSIDECSPDADLERILDALKARGIKAVFFLEAARMFEDDWSLKPRAREILERILEEGHELGNHSFGHPNFTVGRYADGVDDAKEIGANIDKAQGIIDKILGRPHPLIYFRPPYGKHDASVRAAAKERELLLVNWQVTAYDWEMNFAPDKRRSPEGVKRRLLAEAAVCHGGVILLHSFPKTAAIFDELLAAVEKATNDRGPYRWSTVRELVALKYGIEP